MNGVELKRERFAQSEPVAPTGEGGPLSFSAPFIAELGVHDFELRLDVNSNISEHREDNNIESASYTVVEPYVARIDGPTETPRINPGSSEVIPIQLTAIGSTAGTWSLSYDSSNLPSGWMFQSSTGQTLSNELVPNQPLNVNFDASLPSSALGDESGYVDFHLELESDSSVNVSYRLPVEVFRTRGLDIAGPTGVNETFGQGRPGTVAMAWFLVENLGNAQETTTSIQWTAPSWGGSPSLHDGDGNELFSLSLQPGEQLELFAHLDTPVGASYGSQTQSTLTICLGSGQQSLCESFEVMFTAVKISADPTHHRSLPNATLSWHLEGSIPESGMIQWNMAQAQMLHDEWEWSTTGDWIINGTFLEVSGSEGQSVGGNLNLNLPPDAEPQRHSFVEQDDDFSLYEMNITLQVLQVYRANVSILEPLPTGDSEVLSLNVSEPHMFLLYLVNPGNGVDNFRLTTDVRTHVEDISAEVNYTYFGNDLEHYQTTLGPKSTGIGRVDITLSQEVPAQVPFILEFTWTSLEGDEIYHSTSTLIQAAPSHEWNVSIVGNDNLTVLPGDEVVVNLTSQNLGNAPDIITLQPELIVQYSGLDASIWSAVSATSDMVGINQSINEQITVHVPEQAWHGTAVTLKILHMSNGYVLGHTNVSFTVGQTSGWKLNLTDAQLEIDPAGQNMTLVLQHLGNGFETPYFSKATAGWNITLPQNFSVVDPFATSSLNVYVQPPEDAVAGEVGMLSIRISDDDLAGLTVEVVPVRIGAAPNLSLEHRSSWMVSQDGGYPTAWVENRGNDIALLSFSVSGLPEGWTTGQGSQLVLAPNEVRGIPLSLVPASDWDSQRFLVTIHVNHPLLGILSHDMEVESSSISFSQSPVVDAYIGIERSVSLFGASGSAWVFTSSLDLVEQNNHLVFEQPTSSGEFNVQYTNGTNEGNLSLYLISRAYPEASSTCSLTSQSLQNLGKSTLEGTIGTCELTAGDTDDLRAVMTAMTSDGKQIPLNKEAWFVSAGGNMSIDISVDQWNPDPGIFSIQILILDQYGRTLSVIEQDVIAREENWNVGISSLSSDGSITIGISRVGYTLLDSSTCRLSVESDSGWSIEYDVDVANSDTAPIFFIEDPGVLEKDDEITATIACETPFDVDDDPDDNTKSIYYQPSNVLSVSSSDAGWIVGIAAAVLALAWFGGLIAPRQKREEGMQESTSKDPLKLDEAAKKEDEIEEVIEEIDAISIVEENIDLETPIEIDEELLPTNIEVFEAPVEEDDTASGRLASLRSELGDGEQAEPSEPLEDRMNRFFGK